MAHESTLTLMARTAKGSGRFPVRQGAGALFPGQAVDAGILAGHLAGYALRGELHGGTRPQFLDGSNVDSLHVEPVKGHGKVQHIVGIWIEPEMVNPKSELYEQHKDWVIHLPNRDEYYFRNQMVLDLSNPKVQDFVFGVVDGLMTEYPGIAYFKWDCNSPITNIYSPYLKDRQTHLYVDYVRGLYKVLDRIKAKYPKLPMMLCSGGSGRIDYEALKYFTEFWASDNTDPIGRLFIQYGYSFFYPAKSMSAHVTTWNKDASIKFRTDVAMMGKLGFDIKLTDMSGDELTYCQQAIKNYKRLRPAIMEGDMYRLVSPYSCNHAATQFVAKGADKAVVFAFDVYPAYGEHRTPIRLEGLNPDKRYKVTEINMMPGQGSWLEGNGQTFSGDYLMTAGLNLFTGNKLYSRVIEITAE